MPFDAGTGPGADDAGNDEDDVAALLEEDHTYERTRLTELYGQAEDAYSAMTPGLDLRDAASRHAAAGGMVLVESANHVSDAVRRRIAERLDAADDDGGMPDDVRMYERTPASQLHDRVVGAYRSMTAPVVAGAQVAGRPVAAAANTARDWTRNAADVTQSPLASIRPYLGGAGNQEETSDTAYHLEDVPMDEFYALLDASEEVRYAEKIGLFDPALDKAHANPHKVSGDVLADDLQAYPDDTDLRVEKLDITYKDTKLRYEAVIAGEHAIEADAGDEASGLIDRGIIASVVDALTPSGEPTKEFRVESGKLDYIVPRSELDGFVDTLLDPHASTPEHVLAIPGPDEPHDEIRIGTDDFKQLLREADEIQVDREEEYPIRDRTDTHYARWSRADDDDMATLVRAEGGRGRIAGAYDAVTGVYDTAAGYAAAVAAPVRARMDALADRAPLPDVGGEVADNLATMWDEVAAGRPDAAAAYEAVSGADAGDDAFTAEDVIDDIAGFTRATDIALQQRDDRLYLRATNDHGRRDQTVVARIDLDGADAIQFLERSQDAS